MSPPDPTAVLLLRAAWCGMLLGLLSGAVIGLFFHREDWMGGYQSYRRRLTRLGHISFFGLAFVNLGAALTLQLGLVAPGPAALALPAFLTGAATMPTVCFLSAWNKPFRHLFFVPVLGVLTGIAAILAGWTNPI
jgi:hypothetical protein